MLGSQEGRARWEEAAAAHERAGRFKDQLTTYLRVPWCPTTAEDTSSGRSHCWVCGVQRPSKHLLSLPAVTRSSNYELDHRIKYTGKSPVLSSFCHRLLVVRISKGQK